MNEERANVLYDILVEFGAVEHMRDSFIYHHTKEKDMCGEWRFGGIFGYGGKYLSYNNVIAYEKEDWSDVLELKRIEINKKLSKFKLRNR